MDIRLQEQSFTFEGREYKLRCNFNVLADVQEECGGFIPDVLNTKRTLKNTAIFLSAMMNDYADEMGWEDRFSAKQLGRKLDFKDGLIAQMIMDIVVKSMFVPGATTEESKN